MKYLFSILLFLLFEPLHSQTVLIAVKTKNAVYVGADSKTLTQNYNGNKIDSSFGIMCKIVQYKNFYCAVAGSNGEAVKNNFLIEAKESKTFRELITKVGAKVVKEQSAYLTKMAATNWNAYLHYITPRKDKLVQIIFFGRERDSLFLGIGWISVVTSAKREITVNYFTSLDEKYVGSGNIKEIKDSINNPKTWEGSIPNTLDRLINKQIKLYPKNVGHPINIIKVTKSNHVWVRRKTPC